MLLYAQVQPIRRPAYVVTATTTCKFIHNRIDMVGDGKTSLRTETKSVRVWKINPTAAEK